VGPPRNLGAHAENGVRSPQILHFNPSASWAAISYFSGQRRSGTIRAFAAVRRAADRRQCSNQSISHGRPVHSTTANPQQRRLATGWDRQTDGRTDGRTPDRCIDSAPHTMRTVSIMIVTFTCILLLSRSRHKDRIDLMFVLMTELCSLH